MADRPITPAPKPSQKTPAKADDVKEGVVTYTQEELRKNTKKRNELLKAPDGTPGKDVAVRVEAAAPIITAAVKEAKAWNELHGKAAQVTKALADHLARLRTVYEDKDGKPDMRGSSVDYREAAAQIYLTAGFDENKTKHIQGAVRYHLSDSVRAILRSDERFAGNDEDAYLKYCEYYRLNPDSAAVRQKEGRKAIAGGTRLPALTLPDDDAGMFFGAASYALKALDAPGTADPSSLQEDDREKLREEMTAVRDRADEILEKLGDV